jgi:hypothetical protein
MRRKEMSGDSNILKTNLRGHPGYVNSEERKGYSERCDRLFLEV